MPPHADICPMPPPFSDPGRLPLPVLPDRCRSRISSHPATCAYVDRRSKEGLSKKEIIRCLKRYVARQVYPHLRPGAG